MRSSTGREQQPWKEIQMDINQFNEIVDDRILTCRDCSSDFVFAVGEQKHF